MLKPTGSVEDHSNNGGVYSVLYLDSLCSHFYAVYKKNNVGYASVWEITITKPVIRQE